MKTEERKLLTIGQLARLAGVPKHIVVHATQVGLLTPAARSSAGYRLYNERQVQELAIIRQLYDLGFYAEQVRQLLDLQASSLPQAEKEAVFASIYDRHVEYVRERAEHYRSLYEKCLGSRQRKREEIVGG